MNSPYVEGIAAALELKASHAELLEALQKIADHNGEASGMGDQWSEALAFRACRHVAVAAIAKAETLYPRG